MGFMKEIGVGVIGLGMGKNMLAINNDPTSQMEVRSLCDSDATRLEQMRCQHNIAFATTDYRELLARPDIDVVGIYSPDHLHMEHIAAAAAAGKHIICS
jgi:predicted dehydrogenase